MNPCEVCNLHFSRLYTPECNRVCDYAKVAAENKEFKGKIERQKETIEDLKGENTELITEIKTLKEKIDYYAKQNEQLTQTLLKYMKGRF